MADAQNLKRKTFLGTLWMLVGTSGQQIANFAIMVVLARELGPAAFGVVGLAMVVIDILTIIGQAGLTEVFIQNNGSSQKELSTGFWTSLVLGILLGAAVFLSAPLLAQFFGEPDLDPVMKCLSISCLFNTLGTVHEALLRRSFGFKALAARNVTASIVSGAVAIALALNGAGVFSLVAQRVVSTAWLMAALWIAVRWFPSFLFSWKNCLSQLRMGISIAGTSLLGAGNQRVMDLLVGYFLGTTALGYLRIAWKGLDVLLNLSVMPVQRVILTSLSHLQNDLPALARAYQRIVQISSLFIYPVFLGAAVIAPELVLLAFGPKWEPSVPLMQLYTFMGFFIPLAYFRNNVLYAVKRADKVFAISVVSFIVSVVVYVVAVRIGIAATAFGNVVQIAIMTPISMAAVQKYTGARAKDTLLNVLPPTVASLAMVAVLWTVRVVVNMPVYPILSLGISVALGALIYVGILYIFFRKYWDEVVGLLPLKVKARFSKFPNMKYWDDVHE